MEKHRHKTESGEHSRLYFEFEHHKMAQCDLEPAHTYNMVEKGFTIGIIGRSKRMFAKTRCGKKHFKQSLHNGNRE